MNKPEIVKLLEEDKKLFLDCVAAQLNGINPARYVDPMEIMAFVHASLCDETFVQVRGRLSGKIEITYGDLTICGDAIHVNSDLIELHNPTYSGVPVSTIYLQRLHDYYFLYNTELIAIFKYSETI